MRVLLVVESCFGNTGAVAEAVARALRQAGAEVEEAVAGSAPARPDADLVLVGSPTHNMGLPTAASRTQAAGRGGAPVTSGVREWIDRADVEVPVVAFATRTKGRFSGSASRAAVKQLRRRGVDARQGEDFVVTGVAGPLGEGELERAGRWAQGLVP
jgi:hypothetical protein